MKTLIYWFSGTGNSLAVAKAIVAGVPDAELVPVAGASGDEGASAEAVGIVFPVYCFGLPAIVAELLRKITITPQAYVFAVATYAGAVGPAVAMAERTLAKRGIKLAAGYSVKMPHNYPPMGGPDPPEKQRDLFERAQPAITRIVEDVAALKRGHVKRWVFGLRWIGRVGNRIVASKFPQADGRFYVDEKCTGCGICERICPVGNIALVDGKPTWLHHCQQCFACLHWCPTAAVQFGKKSPGQARYHHPDATLEEMLAQGAASRAEEAPTDGQAG